MDKVRENFEILKNKELVFFDNCASTLKPKNVAEFMAMGPGVISDKANISMNSVLDNQPWT